jgi:hypothetical protein
MSESAYASPALGRFEVWNKWWFWGPVIILAWGLLLYYLGYATIMQFGYPWYIAAGCVFSGVIGYWQLFRVLNIGEKAVADMMIPFTLVDMLAGLIVIIMINGSHSLTGWGILVMAGDMAFLVSYFHYTIIKMELKSPTEKAVG